MLLRGDRTAHEQLHPRRIGLAIGIVELACTAWSGAAGAC